MNTPFPFDLPAPSVWYVVLYATTLLLHVAFMSYVLGGALLLGLAGVRRRLGGDAPTSPSARVLKDWMPSALSAAITAGIAPLLFVQILYQQEFYTANLLSFHRWMAILPVLIAAFYLLYLLKSRRVAGRTALQALIAISIAACVLFVAWSWVENHLLSLDRAAWPLQYEEKRMLYASPAILPRLAFFVAASLATFPLLLLAQMRAGATGCTPEEASAATRPFAITAIVSGIAALALAGPVLRGPLSTAGIEAPAATPWWTVLVIGMGVAIAGWSAAAWRAPPARIGTLMAAIGTTAFWIGATLLRESTRWSIAGDARALERHGEVGTTAGLIVFLVFTLAGVAAVAWIWRRVAKALRP